MQTPTLVPLQLQSVYRGGVLFVSVPRILRGQDSYLYYRRPGQTADVFQMRSLPEVTRFFAGDVAEEFKSSETKAALFARVAPHSTRVNGISAYIAGDTRASELGEQ